MRVIFARDLIEESTRQAVAVSGQRALYDRERESCYGADADDRDAQFARVHEHWFTRLGLAGPVHATLAERPRIASAVAVLRVETAIRPGDQGIELFVAAPDPEASDAERRWLVARIVPGVLIDAEAATAMLRPELLHIDDMLDPAFQYEPELPPSPAGPTHDRLRLERYGALWSASVAYRLDKEGRGSPALVAAAHARLERAFPMHAGAIATTFPDLLTAAPPRHGDFVAQATEPRGTPAGPVRGARCSLCGFPTYAFAKTADVVRVGATVRIDFPAWHAGEPTCPQCVDLYAARLPASASIIAATDIPDEHA
jgi:hypothetical protein